jgi:hypothetical protein
MGLGLLLLVSIGKENLYLSAQPEITFFKIAYKRHTNYSIEPTPQYFKTTPDFSRRCTVSIGKNADLMGMTYICIQLPNIIMENFSTSSSSLKNFSWVSKIGLALINYVEVEIGGTIIDRHYGDWLNIWYEMVTSMGLSKSYNRMIGNTTELISYTKTKDQILLYIPLSFWFCMDTGLALPLIGMAHSDVKIHVEFNDFNNCYKVSPSYYLTVNDNFCLYKKGEQFYQQYQNNKIIGEFISFDDINMRLYYNPIKGTFLVPSKTNDTNYVLTGANSNYKMNITPNTVVVKDMDYFQFNQPSIISAYLLVNYIYLDTYERLNFMNNSHEYLIPRVQTLPDQIINSVNAIYKLPLINPIKLIVWRVMLASNKIFNNNFIYTSYPFTTTEQDLIVRNKLVINSINRMDLDNIEYYSMIQKYQYDFMNSQRGIYMYSFALNPRDLQPSGSMNFSKVDDAYIQLTLNNIINYQNPAIMKAYAIEYNLFRTSHGIGGLVFNL